MNIKEVQKSIKMVVYLEVIGASLRQDKTNRLNYGLTATGIQSRTIFWKTPLKK